MNDSSNWQQSYSRYGEAVNKANDLNKAIVFDALIAAGITNVIVGFDGEGDSGQIDGAAAYAGDKLVNFPDTKVTIHDAQYNKDDLDTRETTLRDAVEDLCYGYLEQEHGGWEINDGAYGEFTIDVPARKISLDFNARFTDSFYYRHTF